MWTDTSYFGLPADFSKISRLIGDLNEAKLDRFVTSSPERLARLEFKDSEIQLLDASGAEIWSLYLGKAPDSGSGRFIRFGTESKAFLSNLSVYIDTDAKNWADSQLVNLKADDVGTVSIALESGAPVVLTRKKKEDPWTAAGEPAGFKVKPEAVSSLLSSLGSLRFSDSSATDDPAAVEARKHVRAFVLTTFDGKTTTIALGRKPEEKKIKPPVADAKSGPASLGKVSDLKADGTDKSADKTPPPAQPEFDTIPAGPVYVFVEASDAHAAVNELMKRRAFQVDEYTYTSLPKTKADVLDIPAPPAPAQPPSPAAAAGPAKPAIPDAPAPTAPKVP